jgi:hypothetical protein
MTNRQNTFLLKRSNVSGKIPLPGDIKLGEVALNTADVILYASGTTTNEILPIGWDRISRTGDTVTGNFLINGGLTATTISATTYQNLPLDVYVTGGTFNTSNDTITLTRNDGNTVPISGITDWYTTGFTYLNNTFSIKDNSGSTFNATINTMTGLTVNGNLIVTGNTNLQSLTATTVSATTVLANTIGASGNCVNDIYVSNIHSCSPLNINPLDEGNVYFGSTSGVTVDVSNNRLGINTSNPQYRLDILDTNSRFYYDPSSAGGLVVVSGTTEIPRIGMVIPSYLTKPAAGVTIGLRAWDDTIYNGYGKVGDMFMISSAESNGLNLISAAGSGTEDYIRFYAGQDATGIADVHINGTGSTKGFVGIGTETPSSILDVNGKTKTTTLQITSNSDINGKLTVTGDTNLQSLTANTIYTDYIDFNNNLSPIPTNLEGRVFWDEDNGSLSLGMHGSQVSQQIGLEQYYYIRNQSGATIENGKVVRSAGTLGNSGRILGEYMIADGTIPYYFTLGVATEDILNGEDGYVTEFGLVRGINTTGSLYGETWVDGTILYVSPTISGGLTSVEPIEPNLKIQIAIVVNANNNGSLFVRPSLGYNLGDLHNLQTSGQTNGDLISYNSSQGYWGYTKTLNGNYTISGNTSQIGNYHITGNTNQIGVYSHSGNTFITGNTSQIGNYNTTGNTTQYGNTYISGSSLSGQCAFEVDGNVCIDGNVSISGNTTQTGSTSQIGDVLLTGNTNQLGYLYIISATTGCTFAVTGNTCLDGNLDIIGDTFMSGNFCMNNMNSTGETGTNCLDTSLIPTGTTIVHQFQAEGGVLAHLGDLATGEPNSRGFTYFENNLTNTSFVAAGTGVFTPVIGAPQTFGPYNNLFIVTTGATTATINKLTYNYPPASGTSSETYLKFTVSCTIQNAQNQQLTFQVRRKRGVVFSFLPIGMSITPQSNNIQGITFNGISDSLNNDEFQLVVKNDTGSNAANSIRVVDVSFSMFT